MDRVILHSDMNNRYASIELLHRPELRGKPIAVGGNVESRHGIILAKDEFAKKAGVKTGMPLWEARKICPNIIFVPPNMDLYMRFSRLANNIYKDYTDRVEPFGIDESWLDVTQVSKVKGSGYIVAKEISDRIKKELGVTVSIGVADNKIFAKLGSDYKKPDAITVITEENYKDIVWNLPIEDLLYVGKSTREKLNRYGMRKIGDIANAKPQLLKMILGKMGLVLHCFANGDDQTPVSMEYNNAPIKSIGNSTTTPRDLVNCEDVEIIIYLLAESVSARLRDNNFKGNIVEISVRNIELISFTRQRKLKFPTNITDEIAKEAIKLFKENYSWDKPIRSIGVRTSDLVEDNVFVQLDLFNDQEKRERKEKMDKAIDDIRKRFGFYSIQRGLMYKDRSLSKLNAKEDHTVHPRSYMEYGNRTGIK